MNRIGVRMALWIQPTRLTIAISTLSSWRREAKSQAAMHLWPLLALIEAGVSTSVEKQFTEAKEFEFWNRYFRFPGEVRDRNSGGGFTQHYYVDPLLQLDKPGDYPHRGPWTIRTRTFLNSWHAAEFKEGESSWRLKENFADIFVTKTLSKEGLVHRIPVVDLAVWLFREESFPDGSTADVLEKTFLERFPFQKADYEKLFRFTPEEPSHIFTASSPSKEAVFAGISTALLLPELEPAKTQIQNALPDPPLEEDDAVLQQVRSLIALGTSGIILKGCPGTSKTWYAKKIAATLTQQADHVFHVQFHPAYGYEDFVEGYLPDDTTKAGFRLGDKIFLQACATAAKVPTPVVIIIDEINRGDPARILGELLTYIEHDYRGAPFSKAYSGTIAVVPKNLVLIGTMNEFDRSITQLDLALIRRLDHIKLKPSSELVTAFLEPGDFTTGQVDRVVQWFEALQTILPEDSGGIGHTYFKCVTRPDQLQLMWEYRMLPYCEAILELEPDKLVNAERSFASMFKDILGQQGADEV
jgi:hypothetical protein